MRDDTFIRWPKNLCHELLDSIRPDHVSMKVNDWMVCSVAMRILLTSFTQTLVFWASKIQSGMWTSIQMGTNQLQIFASLKCETNFWPYFQTIRTSAGLLDDSMHSNKLHQPIQLIFYLEFATFRYAHTCDLTNFTRKPFDQATKRILWRFIVIHINRLNLVDVPADQYRWGSVHRHRLEAGIICKRTRNHRLDWNWEQYVLNAQNVANKTLHTAELMCQWRRRASDAMW